MKEYIRIWVILKRVRNKIRSARSPLIIGTVRNWGTMGFLAGLELNLRSDFLGAGSEKGSTRKSTGNWVASWRNCFRGNLGLSRWFTKRFCLGEFKFRFFWAFGREATWSYWGGGPIDVTFVQFGWILGYFPVCVRVGVARNTSSTLLSLFKSNLLYGLKRV
jgi:hypothetical protein